MMYVERYRGDITTHPVSMLQECGRVKGIAQGTLTASYKDIIEVMSHLRVWDCIGDLSYQ